MSPPYLSLSASSSPPPPTPLSDVRPRRYYDFIVYVHVRRHRSVYGLPVFDCIVLFRRPDENIAGTSSGRCRQIASGPCTTIIPNLKPLIFNIFDCRAMFRSCRPSDDDDDDVVAMAGPRNFTIIRAPRYHSRRRLYLFSLPYPYPSDKLTADHPVSNTRGDGPATSENELKYRKQTECVIIILLFLFSVCPPPRRRTPDDAIVVFIVITYSNRLYSLVYENNFCVCTYARAPIIPALPSSCRTLYAATFDRLFKSCAMIKCCFIRLRRT